MLIVIPISLIETPFAGFLQPETPVLYLLLTSVLIIGVLEEGGKSLLLYLLHYRHPEFNEALDGIIYGVTIGLGFAALENMMYTILYGYKIGLLRAVITTLAHASFSGIFGYFLGQARIEGQNNLLFPAFLFVVLLHGLYDFLVIKNYIGLFTVVAIILFLQAILAMLIRRTRQSSPFR